MESPILDALAQRNAWDDGEYRRLVDWLRSLDPYVVVVFNDGYLSDRRDPFTHSAYYGTVYNAFYKALSSRYTISQLTGEESHKASSGVIMVGPESVCSQKVNAAMKAIHTKNKQWTTPLMVFDNVYCRRRLYDDHTPLDIYSENINLSLTTVVSNRGLQYSLATELANIIRGSGGLTKSAAPRRS